MGQCDAIENSYSTRANKGYSTRMPCTDAICARLPLPPPPPPPHCGKKRTPPPARCIARLRPAHSRHRRWPWPREDRRRARTCPSVPRSRPRFMWPVACRVLIDLGVSSLRCSRQSQRRSRNAHGCWRAGWEHGPGTVTPCCPAGPLSFPFLGRHVFWGRHVNETTMRAGSARRGSAGRGRGGPPDHAFAVGNRCALRRVVVAARRRGVIAI